MGWGLGRGKIIPDTCFPIYPRVKGPTLLSNQIDAPRLSLLDRGRRSCGALPCGVLNMPHPLAIPILGPSDCLDHHITYTYICVAFSGVQGGVGRMRLEATPDQLVLYSWFILIEMVREKTHLYMYIGILYVCINIYIYIYLYISSLLDRCHMSSLLDSWSILVQSDCFPSTGRYLLGLVLGGCIWGCLPFVHTHIC
jgi:hypothetical protein